MKLLSALILMSWLVSFEPVVVNHPIYDEALKQSAKSKRHILILFTSKTCANPLEATALMNSNEKIRELVQSEFILLELFVDDSTPLTKREVYMSNTGTRIQTVGGRNADLEIQKFGENVQPYYAIVDWDEVVIRTSKHIESSEDLMEFLSL